MHAANVNLTCTFLFAKCLHLIYHMQSLLLSEEQLYAVLIVIYRLQGKGVLIACWTVSSVLWKLWALIKKVKK